MKTLTAGLRAALVAGLALYVSVAGAAPKPIPDDRLMSHVTNKLFYDKFFKPDLIKVEVNEGVVTLSGTVNDLRSKERALQTVERLQGVRAVVDRLKLQTAERADEQIRKDVNTALLLDSATESYELDVKVSDGVVRLTGTVETWPEKSMAAWVAKGVKGVKGVENAIAIDFSKDRPDSELKRDIVSKLKRAPWIAEDLVTVDVKNKKATLRGTVGSAWQKSRAYASAWVHGIKDVDVAGLKVEPWRQPATLSPQEYSSFTDEQIRAAVRDAFLYDPRVFSFNPVVSVKNKVVTLSGTVDNAKAKQAAELDARKTTGVFRVVNNLKVRPAAERTDAAITRDVRALLTIDPLVDRYQLSVSTKKGVVSLGGTVDTAYERWLAEDIASRIRGVTDVKNDVKVTQALAVRSDREIERSIRESLASIAAFDPDDKVKVSAKNGRVTLSGIVDNWSEHTTATGEAFDGGATSVYNNLRVRSAGQGVARTYYYSVAPVEAYSIYWAPLDSDEKEAPKAERKVGSE